jgi:hypothetical protein
MLGPAARDFFAPEQTPQRMMKLPFSLRYRKERAANPGNVSGIEGERT